MSITILLFYLFVSLVSTAQDKALLEYEHIFNEAKNAEKKVILVFGHEYCGWCRLFDRYHADPEVKSILDENYIIHKIDILESKAGERLFDYYKLPGTPVWMIYDSKMELLSNGKNDDNQIIGYPYTQSEIQLYLGEIRKTSTDIDETELKTLGQKLQTFGNNRGN